MPSTAPCGGPWFLAIVVHPIRQTKKENIMAKLRHIALIVPDPDKAAKFFEEAFDMKVAGRARRGLYVSDGIMNVALLKQEGQREGRHLSLRHVGR